MLQGHWYLVHYLTLTERWRKHLWNTQKEQVSTHENILFSCSCKILKRKCKISLKMHKYKRIWVTYLVSAERSRKFIPVKRISLLGVRKTLSPRKLIPVKMYTNKVPFRWWMRKWKCKAVCCGIFPCSCTNRESSENSHRNSTVSINSYYWINRKPSTWIHSLWVEWSVMICNDQ